MEDFSSLHPELFSLRPTGGAPSAIELRLERSERRIRQAAQTAHQAAKRSRTLIQKLPPEILECIISIAADLYAPSNGSRAWTPTRQQKRTRFLLSTCQVSRIWRVAQTVLWRTVVCQGGKVVARLAEHLRNVVMEERPQTHRLVLEGAAEDDIEDLQTILSAIQGIRYLDLSDYSSGKHSFSFDDFCTPNLGTITHLKLGDVSVQCADTGKIYKPPFQLQHLTMNNCASNSPHFYTFFSSSRLRLLHVTPYNIDHQDIPLPLSSTQTRYTFNLDFSSFFQSVAPHLQYFEFLDRAASTTLFSEFHPHLPLLANLYYMKVEGFVREVIEIANLVPSCLTSASFRGYDWVSENPRASYSTRIENKRDLSTICKVDLNQVMVSKLTFAGQGERCHADVAREVEGNGGGLPGLQKMAEIQVRWS